jgi:hypothetical protein
VVRHVAGLFLGAAALAWSPPAFADGAETLEPAPPPPQPAGHHFVFGQGVPILIRRLTVGYEYMPGSHHSFGLTLHGQAPGTYVPTPVKGAATGFGGEIGYRFYGGSRGPGGPFVGASFLCGGYASAPTFLAIRPKTTHYAQYGVALEVGWAVHIDRTIVLAMGIGVQRTWIGVDRERLSDFAQMVVGDGVRPRAMIQVGRVF